jgi:transposase InsO family protein
MHRLPFPNMVKDLQGVGAHKAGPNARSIARWVPRTQRDADVRPFTASVGDAHDNAMAKAFIATIECELLDRRCFRSQAEARMAVFHLIEGFHDPTRCRSTLGYSSRPSNMTAGRPS